MIDPDLSCQEELRREVVRSKSIYGLDYVEVSDDDQRTLKVVFLGKAPPPPLTFDEKNIRITGGRRIRDIKATSAPRSDHPIPRWMTRWKWAWTRRETFPPTR